MYNVIYSLEIEQLYIGHYYTEYGVRSTVCARSLKLSNVAPG